MNLHNSVSQFGFEGAHRSISVRPSQNVQRFTRLFGRCGYTLLELLLALGLTVAIVSIIATAIRVNGLTLTRVQASIERKQAARSILGIVQNDLRAGIQYKANQYAGLKDLFESIRLARGQAAAAVLDTDQSNLSGTTNSDDSQTGSSEEGSDSRDNTTASVETAVSSASASLNSAISQSTGSNSSSSPFTDEEFEEPDADGAPLFIGESNFVSIDVSRLPRIDQYHPAIRTAEESLATLADVKTISYFVSSENGSSRSSGNSAQLAQLGVGPTITGGLFRREIDRSIAVHQGLQGVQGPDEYSQVIAAEVVEIAFRYFDGEGWATSWDSQDRGGFPIAVEVIIWVDPFRIDNSAPPQGVADVDNLEVYRSVVHIPVAEVIEEDEDEN